MIMLTITLIMIMIMLTINIDHYLDHDNVDHYLDNDDDQSLSLLRTDNFDIIRKQIWRKTRTGATVKTTHTERD